MKRNKPSPLIESCHSKKSSIKPPSPPRKRTQSGTSSTSGTFRKLYPKEYLEVTEEIHRQVRRRLDQHGFRKASSIHEIMGILEEEVREAWDEVRHNDLQALRQELLDIAVACTYGVVSIDSMFGEDGDEVVHV